MNPGARITTTRACIAGFFDKGQHGTVITEAGDGCYLVRFDGETKGRWVYVDEMRPVGERRLPRWIALALSWLKLRRELLLSVLLIALTAATVHRIAEIYVPNAPDRFLSASTAARG